METADFCLVSLDFIVSSNVNEWATDVAKEEAEKSKITTNNKSRAFIRLRVERRRRRRNSTIILETTSPVLLIGKKGVGVVPNVRVDETFSKWQSEWNDRQTRPAAAGSAPAPACPTDQCLA